MDRPPRRGARSPPFGYDPRALERADQRPPADYPDDLYAPQATFDAAQSPGPTFAEQHQQSQQYSSGVNHYRDHNRLPSTYRATLAREQQSLSYLPTSSSSAAPYKILCITNINHKVSDGPVKEALISDFSRFGDISVSVCHDSGERLAYIYFRSYEEAREARHAKTRTLLFDRPLEIEPIYETRASPVDSSPSQPPPQPQPPPPPPSQAQAPPPHAYSRRRSITPPDYYAIDGPPHQLPQSARRAPPPPPPPMTHHRGLSPPNYSHSSRGYPPGPPVVPMPPAPVSYGRYYYSPPSLPQPLSPYSSPPHDYRSYPPQPPHHHLQPPPPHSGYHASYGGPPPPLMGRERDRSLEEAHHMVRSPRHDPYYMERGGYPPPPPPPMHHSSSRLHSSSSHHHHHPEMSPTLHHQRRSPPPPPPPPPQPRPDHPRRRRSRGRRGKFNSEHLKNELEEGRPSRVLFVTNIDASKTESDLRDVFDSYGAIEEIEVKKINSGFSSALIKFSSMDCAYKAKTATNGKYFGNLKCRISYGKVVASRRLWIGGFSPSTTVVSLEDEFCKYGDIINLDYISGRPYAYIEYETPNQAQFAAYHLRGTLVAQAERRIRIEFVDSVERNDKVPSKHESNLQASELGSRSRTTNESWSTNEHDSSPPLNSRKRSASPTDSNSKRIHQGTDASLSSENQSKAMVGRGLSSSPAMEDRSSNDRSELNNNREATLVTGGPNHTAAKDLIYDQDNNALDCGNPDRLAELMSIREIIDCCSVSWFGQLVLRNFIFPSKLFMCSGKKETIERYLSGLSGENGDQCPILRITQRWRLHPQPKLEEVKRRMQSGNLGMIIITSRLDQSPTSALSPTCKTPQSSTGQQTGLNAKQENGDPGQGEGDTSGNGGGGGGIGNVDEKTVASSESSMTQSRPLKNLISYLEQKDAAGVISLSTQDREQTEDSSKLLYAFPPGDFALNLLRRLAPNLTPASTKEEFLLGVIVGGSETKI